ncbi:MAG: hypothetical protein IJE89_04885 [Bacilli bacterium]|nr:hypothetical protein [Bacilli bacterium]
MNIIKRHKGLAIICLLVLILIIILFIICSRMIFSTGETEYGNRLNGLIKLEKSVTTEIINETKELDQVENITIRTQGKIVYTTITFKEGTKKNKAKEIANNTLTKYSEEVIGYYDFEYFLKENIKEQEVEEGKEEKKGFVIVGQKHPETEKISWTKN